MKKIWLLLLPALLIACKHETRLKEKDIPNVQEQLIGSFYPYVFSPAQIFVLDPLVDDSQNMSEYPQWGVFPSFGGVFSKLTFTLNKNKVKGANEIDSALLFFAPFFQDLYEEQGSHPNNFKNATWTNLADHPASFRTPVLSDFCSTWDEDTLYLQQKYRGDNIQGDLYAFSLIGKCDSETVRCALIYYVPDNMTMMGISLYEPIFDHPSSITEIMGIEGSHMNCQVMDKKAYPRPGCGDPAALNYNSYVNIPVEEACIYGVQGCTDEAAFNYNPLATVDDGSCVPVVSGCTDSGASNYDPAANVDDESCVFDIMGCTDPDATNYDPSATMDDGSCITDEPPPEVFGCTAPNATNYDPSATSYDGSCICEMGWVVVFDGSACVPDMP